MNKDMRFILHNQQGNVFRKNRMVLTKAIPPFQGLAVGDANYPGRRHALLWVGFSCSFGANEFLHLIAGDLIPSFLEAQRAGRAQPRAERSVALGRRWSESLALKGREKGVI